MTFHEATFLDAAMSVFWERGYRGASMTELVAATGLQKGSLYKAFEGKHDLFAKSLERYLERCLYDLERVLGEAGSATDGLRESASPRCPNRCRSHYASMRTRCGSHRATIEASCPGHHDDVRLVARSRLSDPR